MSHRLMTLWRLAQDGHLQIRHSCVDHQTASVGLTPMRFLVTAFMVVLGLNATVSAQPHDIAKDLSEARRIYVPAEDLDVVVEHDRRGTILSKQKLEEMLALAKANTTKNSAPNLPIVLTTSNYQARIVGDQLLLSVSAELTQFHSDWQSISFAMQRLSVEKATLNDEPAMLGRNQDGSLVLLSDQKGKHTLKLDLSTELTSLGSDQTVAFSLLRAPSGTLSLTLPAGKRLLVGALQLERPTPLDQPAEYKIAIGGAPGVQLRITDRATENSADALTFASTGYGLHVAPGEVTWHALTTLHVFGKPIDRLTVSIPGTLEIADIESTGLEAWDAKDDPNDKQRTVITLTFGQAFDGSRKISFKGVMAVETGKPWSVPSLSISNVTSHIGQVVVQHPAGVRLRIEETVGVRRATQEQKPTADMPDEMLKMNATEFLRFDIWQPDFVLSLTTQPKQREVQTAVAAVLDVNATGLELQALVTVKTQFAPLFELDVRLPAEWSVVSAHRDATSLKWQVLPQDAGVNQLRILLNPPLAADASATVRLVLRREVDGWPVEATPITVNLPELFLPQSNLNEGTFVVRGDDDLDLAAQDLSGLDTMPLKADFERLRFQTQDTRYGGNLKVTRKPSRVSVQTVTFGRLDPQSTHAFLQAMVEVQGGGVRTLEVALPESAGTALRFQSPGRQIVEQKPVNVQNGERIWTLQFDQRVRGQVPLFCDIDQPRGDAKEFNVPQARFINAERQNGFLAVEAGGEQRLTIDARGSDGSTLVEVDPLDLPNVFYAPKERIVAVYRNVTAGAKMTLSEERFDKLPVPTAICPMLNVTTVLGKTGELQHRAVFQLTAVGVQGLRVTLPRDNLLWATLVDGQPVEVRRHGDIYLVPFNVGFGGAVPYQGGHHADQHRQLQLFYRSEVPALTQFGSLEQPPPELAVQTGQGVSQPVDVLDQRWELFYPPKTLFVSSQGALEPEQHLDETSLLGRLHTGIRLPTLTELGQQAFAVIVTIGMIALMLLAYQKGRFALLSSVVAVVVIGFGLLSLTLNQSKRAATSSMTAATSHAKGSKAPLNRPASSMPSGGAELSKKSGGGAASPGESFARDGFLDNAVAETSKAIPALKYHADVEAAKSDFDAKDMPQQQMNAQSEMKQPTVSELGLQIKQQQKIHEEMELAAEQPMAEQDQLQAGFRNEMLGDRPRQKDRSALLSLAIDLNAPLGSLHRTFRYAGADPLRGGVNLYLSYVDERSGTVARIFLIALVALAGWFMRGMPCTRKVSSAVIGLTLPLALFPHVPPSMQIALDGIFFGTISACVLWIMFAVIKGLSNCVCFCMAKTSTCKNATVAAGWVVAMLTVAGPALAQPAGQAPNAAPDKSAPTVHQRTTIVVPVAAGTDPLVADQVLLPFDKFVELYRQAYPDKPFKGTAPVDGGVVESLYAAKIVPNEKTPDESTAEITARYAIRSYVDGQLLVELPIGSVAARSAKLDGKNAPLIVNGVCSKIAISTPGLHVVDFVFSIPARLSGTTGSMTLALMPVPTGRLSLVLPAKDLSVRVNGSSTIYRRVTQGEVQTIEVPVDKGGELTIAWQPEQAKGAAAAVVHVDSVQAVMVTDEGVRANSGFQYRVRQGSIADVTFLLPVAYRLQAVKGADVGGWELQGEGDARKLRVIFRRNVTDTTQLAIEAFLENKVGVEAAVIEIPQLAPQQITNEIGQIAVYVQNQFTLRADKADSLSQIDPDKFNTSVPVGRPKDMPQLAYRFSKRPFVLTLRATRQESQANVTAQQAAFVTLRKQQLTTRLVYNLTGAPRSSFSVALPANYVVLDVKATGLHDWSIGTHNNQSVLTIDLNGPRLGLAEVVLSGTVPRDNDTSSASLIFPQPLDATKLNSMAAVWLDEGFAGTLDSFDGWRSVDSSLINGELKAVRPNLPVQFAFSSTSSTPSAITVKLQRATPKLTANGLAMISVTDVAVVHTVALQWQIDAATTDSLMFTTPSFLAGKLEFAGAGIRETTHVDAGNGRTRWTIWLRTPVGGKYFAAATATLPPATTEVLAPAIVFERGAGGEPVEGQRQYAMLINLSQSQLTSATPELCEAVQREDVPVVVDQYLVDQATELVQIKQLLSVPRWTLQTFAQAASAPASINVADLTTIVSRDGTYRGQAIYTIKNRSRQFLAMKLPANAELMSVFVGNLPSRAVTTKRNNESIQLIALPKTSAASLSFPVSVIYRGSLESKLLKSARLFRQEVDFPTPKIVSQQDDPEFGIPVAKTRWTVWLPDGLDAQPLKATNRNNMTLQQSEQNDLLYEKAAVQELSELLGFVDQNYSFSQSDKSRRTQGTNNRKQLGLALQNAEYLERSVQNASGDSEFNRQKSTALGRLNELKKSVIQDQNQLVAGGIQPNGQNMAGAPLGNNLSISIENSGLPLQSPQQGSIPVTVQNSTTFTGNGVNGLSVSSNGGNGLYLQSALEGAQIYSNNATLLQSNSGNGIKVQMDKDGDAAEGFAFELQNKGEQKKDAEQSGKPVVSSQPSARQGLRRGNSVNIDNLNEAINQQKAAAQQGQGGQGGFGGGQFGNANVNGQQGMWLMNPNNPQGGGQGGFGGGQFGTANFNNSTIAPDPAVAGFGMPTTGTPIGLPGPPNLPYGGPASLQSHTVRNRTRQDVPQVGNNTWDDVPADRRSAGSPNVNSPDTNGRRSTTLGVNGAVAMDGISNRELMAEQFGLAQVQGFGRMDAAPMPGSGTSIWTQTGGLSLGFELPTTGQKLVFSKTGGDPKLALAIRPVESIRWGLNLAWTGVWLAIGIGFVAAINAASFVGLLTRQLPLAVAALGILGFILLPAPLSGCAFATFVIAALFLAWANRHTSNSVGRVS